MAENFNLIWGSNASQSTTWSDSDYQRGWETVGDTPPTAQQFDALQRKNDLKAQELNNTITPIAEATNANNRKPQTAYNVGDMQYDSQLPTGWYLLCTVGGTSGDGDITFPSPLTEDASVMDGTVVWRLHKLSASVANIDSLEKSLAESTGYGIVSGCAPSISGLTVTVAAGVVHLAGGTRKEISSTTVTLDAADSTNPRIDLVYINADGAVAKVTGTAAASPSTPSVPSGGISVCNVTIAAGASTGTVNRVQTIAPNLANYGVVNVKDFGAVGDGVHDDTAAIQAAINYAKNAGKIVMLPCGKYVITDSLSLPMGCELTGLFTGSFYRPDCNITTLLIKVDTNTKAINMADRTAIRNIAMVYPEQDYSSVANVIKYDYTINANSGYVTIENIFIAGAWDFINIGNSQAFIDRLSGYPLHIGININTSDVVHISNVHFNPNLYNGYSTMSDTFYNALVTSEETAAISAGYTDGFVVDNILAYAYTYGLFADSGTGTSNNKAEGTITNAYFDNVAVGVWLNGNQQNFGIQLSNINICPIKNSATSRQGAVVFGAYAAGVMLTADNINVFGENMPDYAINTEGTPYQCTIVAHNFTVKRVSKGVINLSNFNTLTYDISGACIVGVTGTLEPDFRLTQNYKISNKDTNYYAAGYGNGTSTNTKVEYGSTKLDYTGADGAITLTAINKNNFEVIANSNFDTNTQQPDLATALTTYATNNNVVFLTSRAYFWSNDATLIAAAESLNLYKLIGDGVAFTTDKNDAYAAIIDLGNQLVKEQRVEKNTTLTAAILNK